MTHFQEQGCFHIPEESELIIKQESGGMTLADYLKSIVGGLIAAVWVWGFAVFVMIGG